MQAVHTTPRPEPAREEVEWGAAAAAVPAAEAPVQHPAGSLPHRAIHLESPHRLPRLEGHERHLSLRPEERHHCMQARRMGGSHARPTHARHRSAGPGSKPSVCFGPGHAGPKASTQRQAPKGPSKHAGLQWRQAGRRGAIHAREPLAAPSVLAANDSRLRSDRPCRPATRSVRAAARSRT